MWARIELCYRYSFLFIAMRYTICAIYLPCWFCQQIQAKIVDFNAVSFITGVAAAAAVAAAIATFSPFSSLDPSSHFLSRFSTKLLWYLFDGWCIFIPGCHSTKNKTYVSFYVSAVCHRIFKCIHELIFPSYSVFIFFHCYKCIYVSVLPPVFDCCCCCLQVHLVCNCCTSGNKSI